MKQGQKVWVYFGGFWEKAEVVGQPVGFPAKRGSVFVKVESDQDVYRFNKEWVKVR